MNATQFFQTHSLVDLNVLLHRDGNIQRFGLKAKRDVARDIADAVAKKLDSQLVWANLSVQPL